MIRRVGIYARVSKAERDDPTSIPVQLADCRSRAESEGWTVVDEYVDQGISAWDRKKLRPDYERLLSDVSAGRVDTILVRESERLLRQWKEGVRIQDLADSGRLKLIACTLENDINFGRARDEKDFADRVASAVFYSKFLSEKVRATKARRKANGAYTGGGRPFGYQFTRDGLAIELEEAALIHDAVKRLARHDSLYRISMDWNAAGIVTAGGARWRPRTLSRMLLGEHLTGGNGYPRILTEVEDAIVRQALGNERPLRADNGKLDSRGRRIGTRGRPSGRRYPARSLVVCSECGQKLTTGAGAYRCAVSHGGCGKVSIKGDELERHLLEMWVAREVARQRKPEPKAKKATARGPDTGPLLDELRELERRLEDVAAGLAEGTLTVAVAGSATRLLEQRRRKVTDELARTLPEPEYDPTVHVKVKIEDGQAFIASAQLSTTPGTDAYAEQLRELFIHEIEHVTVSPRERRGKAFDPSRVEIAWR